MTTENTGRAERDVELDVELVALTAAVNGEADRARARYTTLCDLQNHLYYVKVNHLAWASALNYWRAEHPNESRQDVEVPTDRDVEQLRAALAEWVSKYDLYGSAYEPGGEGDRDDFVKPPKPTLPFADVVAAARLLDALASAYDLTKRDDAAQYRDAVRRLALSVIDELLSVGYTLKIPYALSER